MTERIFKTSNFQARALGSVATVAFLGAATLMLSPRAANATATRVWTLGGMNRFVLDDANRWIFPHTITRFGNLFYIELYGLEDSVPKIAPDSLRAANDIPGPLLGSADFVPVQATAGGGALLDLGLGLFLGVHLSDYQNPTVKTFLEGPFAATSAGSPNTFGWLPGGIARVVAEANRKFDVFVAYNLEDVAAFGLQFTFGSSKYHFTPDPNPQTVLSGNDELPRTEDDLGASELGFLLSGGTDFSDAFGIDAAFGLTLHNLRYLPNQRVDMIDGGGGLELKGDIRAMIGITEWWELIPAVTLRMGRMSGADMADYGTGLTYNTQDDGPRQNSNITDVKTSMLLLDLGVAGHFKPNDIVQFWGAVGVDLMTQEASYQHLVEDSQDHPRTNPANAYEFGSMKRSTDALPYIKVGLEAKVFSWLDFRGGVVKYLRADTVRVQLDDRQKLAASPNADHDATIDQPFFDYFVGAAAHYEGFFLDVQFDPNWFKRGPAILSGSPGDMFFNGSLGYRY